METKRDEDGLLIAFRCERLKTVNGELWCDGCVGIQDNCDNIENMKKGIYYDCESM